MKKTVLKTGLWLAGVMLLGTVQASTFTLVRSSNNELHPGDSFDVELQLQMDSGDYLTGYGLDLELPATLKLKQTKYPNWAIQDSLQQISASVDVAKTVNAKVTLATLTLEATQAGQHTLKTKGADLINSGAFINDSSHQFAGLALDSSLAIQVKEADSGSSGGDSGSSGGGSMGYWTMALALLLLKRKRK